LQSARARGIVSDDQHVLVEHIGQAIEDGHSLLVADGTCVGKGREVIYTVYDWLDMVARLIEYAACLFGE
jgi:hypothetical protein